MQNSRLTCRHFCSISSELLVRAVHVQSSCQSLERLDKILAHPMIGKSLSTLHFKVSPLWKDPDKAIPTLAEVLDKAGGRISSLNIDLSTLSKYLLPKQKLALEDAHSMTSSLRNLKQLRFYYRARSWDEDEYDGFTQKQLASLRKLLTAMVNVEKLESLHLDLSLWQLDPLSLPPHVGAVKTQGTWSNLSTVILRGVPINCSDLEHLLKCTNSAKGRVSLIHVHLADKSWVPILDILRARHRLAVLTSPSGAECEDMSFATYESMFGAYTTGTAEDDTEVYRYIRGGGTVNPLLPPSEHHSESGLESQ